MTTPSKQLSYDYNFLKYIKETMLREGKEDKYKKLVDLINKSPTLLNQIHSSVSSDKYIFNNIIIPYSLTSYAHLNLSGQPVRQANGTYKNVLVLNISMGIIYEYIDRPQFIVNIIAHEMGHVTDYLSDPNKFFGEKAANTCINTEGHAYLNQFKVNDEIKDNGGISILKETEIVDYKVYKEIYKGKLTDYDIAEKLSLAYALKTPSSPDNKKVTYKNYFDKCSNLNGNGMFQYEESGITYSFFIFNGVLWDNAEDADGFLSTLKLGHQLDSLLNQLYLSSSTFAPRIDPLILDLDGDGIETVGTNAGILFDHDGDGVKSGTGWVSADDGFLVYDKNSDGVINNGGELFGDFTRFANGTRARDGFDALRTVDINGDGA